MGAMLGWNMQGNLGPFTVYQNKHGKPVFFLTAPQKEPPSQARLTQRARFTAAATAWKTLDPAARNAWSLAARLARLRITGYNLWVWYQTKGDYPTIRTIERATATTLLPGN